MTSFDRTISPRFAFELALLQLMPEATQAPVLRALGIGSAELERGSAASTVRMPQQASSDVGVYSALLGPAAVVRPLPDETIGPFAPSTAYCFSLLLWPHLYWAVNRAEDGRSWGVGFQQQGTLAFPEFHPDAVQPIYWTRDALQSLADHHVVHDGWEHQVVERFQFRSREYEGAFVFGMLQEWSRVA